MLKKLKERISYHPDDLFLYGICICYGIGFGYLFIENFAFSRNIAALCWRSFDEVAFHDYVRIAHEGFNILRLNAYAYGWIFWFPIVMITYPFYFLSVHLGIDWPLLVAPRQISLFLMLGTAYILYKIASLYTKDIAVKATILGLYLLTPATGYFSLRFGTVGHTVFFSALAFYLVARKETYDKLYCYLIICAIAMACAIKLSVLLIVPCLLIMVLARFQWRFSKANIILAGKSLCLFVPVYYFFSHIDITNFLEVFNKHITIPNNAIHVNPIDNQLDFRTMINRGVFQAIFPIGIFVFLLLGLLWQAYILFHKQQIVMATDMIAILVTVLFAIIFLGVTVLGPGTGYFAVVYFLLPLGVLVLQNFSSHRKYGLSIILLLVTMALNYPYMFPSTYQTTSWNIFSQPAKFYCQPRKMKYISILSKP